VHRDTCEKEQQQHAFLNNVFLAPDTLRMIV